MTPSLGVLSHSWISRSLLDLAATPPEPPTIGGVLYPAKRTVISGETEAMKTWFALILAKAEMDIERPVVWADIDAMGAGEILDRLRALGVADPVIEKFFLFKEPSERLAGGPLEETCAEVADRGVRLFVIDSFNPMLYLHGLDPNKTADIEGFWQDVASPITAAGAAPALIDHVPKNPENRGRYSIGSERKASGAIVHIGFELNQPLVRGGTGKALLWRRKDRPGFLPHPTIGRLVLESNGGAISYRLERDHSRPASGEFRPTALMERVSRELEHLTEPVSQNWIVENVKGKAEALRQALKVLVDEGYVFQSEAGNRSVRQYREDEDSFDTDGLTDESLTSPGRVPTLLSSPHDRASPQVPLSLRERDGDSSVGGAGPDTESSSLPEVWECASCARIYSSPPEICKCGRAA